MNKSELELQNLGKIIGAMPVDENRVCVNMIASLLASLGDPETGKTFMIAIAYVNTQCAVSAIAMGLVKPDGEQGETDETPEELSKMGQNAKLHGKMAMGGLTVVKRDGSVGSLKRTPIGPGAEPRRKQMWPQYGMSRERYVSLMDPGNKELITHEEIKNGWFYDDQYDGLLANHAWEGHE